MKDDGVYLAQILDSVEKVESFVGDLNKDQFLIDQKTQSSVIMQLALIGELTKKISPETKIKIDLPWKDIAGFRDNAIHNYFEIDLEVVWQTIIDDLPLLKLALSNYSK